MTRYIKPVLLSAIAIAAWSLLAIYGGLSGWWMKSVVESDDNADFHRWAVGQIETLNSGASALVLIEDGAVTHRHFGGSANAQTLFPTASMSKWITALSIISLVENGQIDLDAPVSNYLTRWQLPQSEFELDLVTTRSLLSHTSGLTDRLGFGDYAGDEVIPTLEETLHSPRSSSGEAVTISVGTEPGSEFLYSGGGYLILQLLVEEVSGERFADYVQRSIFEPVQMPRSTYAYFGDLDNATQSFNLDGSVAPSYQYAAAAATGLASCAADLSNLALALTTSAGAPISPESVIEMRKPHGFMFGAGIWGLGTILYAPTASGDFVYGHDGANEPAINTSVRINPDTSDAFILLLTGHPTLASQIGAEWVLWQTGAPDFLSAEKALRSAATPVIGGSLIIVLTCIFWTRRRRQN